MAAFQQLKQPGTFDHQNYDDTDAQNSDAPHENPHLRVIEEHRKSSH